MSEAVLASTNTRVQTNEFAYKPLSFLPTKKTLETQGQIDFIEFFYQSPQTLLDSPAAKIKILKRMVMLLEESVEAVTCFLSGNLSKFDPHVGEASCQLRAYNMVRLWEKKYLLMSEYILKKNQVLSHIIKIIAQIERHKKLKNSQKDERTLSEFFAENQLNFTISKEWACLTLAHFLTKYNIWADDCKPLGLNNEEITSAMRELKNAAVLHSRHFQRLLTQFSCEFVFTLLEDMPELAAKRKEVLQLLQKVGENGKVVLPCFGAMEVIVEHLIKTKSTVCLVLQTPFNSKIRLFFTGANNGFKLVDVSNLNNGPCFYVQANTNFTDKASLIEMIGHYGLKTILLSNMASHPQYTGDVLKRYRNDLFIDILPKTQEIELSIKEYEKDFVNYRNAANIIGCSINKPGLIFIKHIRCELVFNMLNMELHENTALNCLKNSPGIFMT